MGRDISGEIVEKSENTNGFEIGDGVFALLQNAGGYVEFVAVNIELLGHKPKNITFEAAAAAPMVGLTAYQPLVHGMNIKNGDKILIHEASGGVGHYAIQIAKYLGAEVIATSSGKSRDFVMSLGTDKHIDYQNENFWKAVKDVDFVFDTIGGETLERSIEVIKPSGLIILILALINEELMSKAQEKNVKLSLWGLQFNGKDLRAFAELMSEGVIKSCIAKNYSFASMVEAHQQVVTRRTAGKIVLTI